MLLVATTGKGSFDRYSKHLAERATGPVLWTDIYEKVARRFGVHDWDTESIGAYRQEREFFDMIALNKRDGGKVDCVHYTNHHLARYGLHVGIPYIVTVHDTIRFFDLSGADNRYVRRHEPYASRPNARDRENLLRDIEGIRHAEHIIAVSDHTKADLMSYCNIDDRKISVVYEAVDTNMFHPTSFKVRDYKYILFVGTEYPRKNFASFLRAFAILKKESGVVDDVKIVKAGNPGGIDDSLREESLRVIREEGLEDDVNFTGYISESSLVSLYSHAECLVMPSLYEGFGFPILEAMACDCPVVTSNSSSLRELAYGYAELVDPEDDNDIAKGIRSVLTDESRAEELVQLGRRRVSQFSWDIAAKETRKVYDLVEDNIRAKSAAKS